MKTVIHPRIQRSTLTLLDNITYSHAKQPDGSVLDLKLSILLHHGNQELRLASGLTTDVPPEPLPAIIWVPGGAWRGTDKNQSIAEMQFLAERGFALVSMYYRSSAQAHYPAQLIDVKTAVRFIRAHAEQYHIDPHRIGMIGRSAGGYLASMAAMNNDLGESDEWSGYSSDIQACCDLFGPVDLSELLKKTTAEVSSGRSRWSSIKKSHEGALLGGSEETLPKRAYEASPIHYINDAMCPIAIFHGDQDPIVPLKISEDFYDAIVSAGLENHAEFYQVTGAGHGTREFFQDSTKQLIADFFTRQL